MRRAPGATLPAVSPLGLPAVESLIPGAHKPCRNHLEADEFFRLIGYPEESGELQSTER